MVACPVPVLGFDCDSSNTAYFSQFCEIIVDEIIRKCYCDVLDKMLKRYSEVWQDARRGRQALDTCAVKGADDCECE